MRVFMIFLFLVGFTVSSVFVNEAYGSVVEIEFDDMVHQSDLVLIGNITNIEPTYEIGAFGSLKDQFFHDVTLDIEMTLFRDISITEVSFRIQKDRSLGEQTADISTSQDFEIGERVLVFLAKETNNDYWDDQYHVLGLHQGKYSLVNEKAFGSHFNGISEDDLISKIYEIKRENKITKHSLDSSFQLSYNQTGLVANQLYITFTELKEDSRCPSDVTCIWQGRASVQLDFRDGKHSTQKTLSVGGDSSPSAVVFDKYKIELLDIKPKPVSTNPITKSDYEITVMVTKPGFIPSPLKQIQNGVSPEMIKCGGLTLVQKYDGSPACVKSETKEKLIERGWTKTEPTLSKGNDFPLTPERTTDSEMKLRKAKDALETAYINTVNVGNFYIKDVIVGFGTYDNTLVIDIPSEYIGTRSMDAIKQDIRHIVGNDVQIDYVLYDESIARFIPTVMPYLWNQVLNQKGIEYVPKNQTYWNHGDGFAEHDKVCSPIIASNGTELYISTTFDLEPFQITGTHIDKQEPGDCHKTWKTDAIMPDPDRVTALWLKNQMIENEN